ncbi:MAG: hypothetical protein ABI679_03895 [Gemmatimonadota bacterium]
MLHDDELTPEERAAFDMLPLQREPSSLLEERTVLALRSEGRLRARQSRAWMGTRWVIAAAAAVMVYLGGIATGQWLSARETATALASIERNNAMQAAMLVQRTGSAYAQAIAALAHAPDSPDGRYLLQGREVALTALYAAANEVVRMAPDDPVVVRILQVLDHERDHADTTKTATHRVIWF